MVFTFTSVTFAQSSYKGPCYDGKEDNPPHYASVQFHPKKFRRKYNVNLVINKMTFGDSIVKTDLVIDEKIRYETQMLAINDSLSIKVELARTESHGEKEILYKILLLKTDGYCWRLASSFYFNPIYAKEMPLFGWGIGISGNHDFIQITEGILKIE